MFKTKLSIVLLSVVLCASLLGAFGVQAECSTGCSSECPTGCPQFNNCSGDLELLTLKNRTQNTPTWQSSISANSGDTVAFNVYYHNCVTESTANNTKIRIDFTNVESAPIVTTAYLWADNASYVTDSGNINLTTPQKLNFASTAKWYPNQTNSNPTIVSVTVNVTSAEVTIGNIQGGWPTQGWVVFEATLSGTPTNHPPTANAGSDKDVQEENSTTLNGSGSDPDGDPLTYSWSCTGGSLSSYSIAQPTYTAPQVSNDTNYTCTLTVNDGRGGSNSDSMTVMVRNNTPSNHAPTANAGSDKDNEEGETTTLNGSGSDPDGDPLTYSWSCTGGSLSSYSIAQPTYNAPTVSYNNYYTCVLTVRDDEGLTDSDSMVVYVRDQADRNLYVSLTANPSSGDEPLSNVSLTANLSGTAVGEATYKFDCTNDGSWERITSVNSNSNTAYSLCNYYSSGNYTARVEVNRDGTTNSATTMVYVHDNDQDNHAPTANAGPDKDIYENQYVTLEGSGYDQDGQSLYYSWSCTGGSLSSYNTARPTYTAPSVSYNNYYTCVLTVRDNEGLTDSDSMVVYVRDQVSSNLYVSLTPNPASGNSPLNNVSLTANLSGTASGDITYKFDCTNDGSWEKITSANSNTYTAYNLCSYYTNGNYTAKVEATRGGMTNSATTVIYVSGSSQSGTLAVTKLVKNMSDGTGWLTVVSADPGEVLYFSIQVTAGNNIQNVSVRDILPVKINYEGELKLDDVLTSGDILNGLNIGDLSAGQTRTISFKAIVAGNGQFSYGTTELTNTATVTGSNSSSVSGTAKVNVTRGAVAGAITEVVTGINPLYISFFIAFLLALAFYFFWTNLEKSQNPSARKFLSWYYRTRSLLFK